MRACTFSLLSFCSLFDTVHSLSRYSWSPCAAAGGGSGGGADDVVAIVR